MRQTRAQLIAAGIVKPSDADLNPSTTGPAPVAKEAAARGVSISQVRRERNAALLPTHQRDLRAVIALQQISAAIRARSTR